MQNFDVERHFRNIHFMVNGKEIHAKSSTKVKALRSKIQERTRRISKLKEQYKITDQDMITYLRQGAHSLTSNAPRHGAIGTKVIPAGVFDNINTEQTNMDNEAEQVKSLELLMRNIDTEKQHELNFEELEYLGF